MIRDRGKIKWQSVFFMPEHVSMLKNLERDNHKQKKPILDEQEYEEIEIVIIESLNYTIEIQVKIWRDGFIKALIGIVSKVDIVHKRITFESNEEIILLRIDEIISVERV